MLFTAIVIFPQASEKLRFWYSFGIFLFQPRERSLPDLPKLPVIIATSPAVLQIVISLYLKRVAGKEKKRFWLCFGVEKPGPQGLRILATPQEKVHPSVSPDCGISSDSFWLVDVGRNVME